MPGPIENTHYDLTVPFSPEAVLRALVDFSDRRPRVWRETSHPAVYAVHRLGETDAEVTEGVPFAWSRELYDWSNPGHVTLSQLDSNVAREGLIQYRIEATAAGARIVCDRHRRFFGWRGRLAGSVMVLVGERILKRQLRNGIERWINSTAR